MNIYTALPLISLLILAGVNLLPAAVSNAGAAELPKWTHLSSKTGDLPAPNVGRQCSALIFDIDRDGTNDFLIAGWGENGEKKIEWFRRRAGGWDEYLIDADVKFPEAGGDFADIDGDGDLDFAIGGDWRSVQVWWWENPYPDFGLKFPWKRHLIKNTDEGGKSQHDIVLGDFDGDGKTDPVFWNQTPSKLFFARRPAEPRTTEPWVLSVFHQFSAPPRDKYEGLAKGDLNGDGKLDVVGGGHWFQNEGGGKFSVHPIDPGLYASRAALGDLVEGGDPEVVFAPGDIDGPLNWYERKGDAWTRHTLVPKVVHGHSLQVADINGDGHLDIFSAEMALRHNGKNPQARCASFTAMAKATLPRRWYPAMKALAITSPRLVTSTAMGIWTSCKNRSCSTFLAWTCGLTTALAPLYNRNQFNFHQPPLTGIEISQRGGKSGGTTLSEMKRILPVGLGLETNTLHGGLAAAIRGLLAALGVVVLLTVPCKAEVLLYDATLTVTANEHGFKKFNTPASAVTNWLTPADFYNGQFHIRYEVLDYPSDKSFKLSTCIWADVVRGNNGKWQERRETCAGQVPILGKGVFLQQSTPANWCCLQKQPVDFARVGGGGFQR